MPQYGATISQARLVDVAGTKLFVESAATRGAFRRSPGASVSTTTCSASSFPRRERPGPNFRRGALPGSEVGRYRLPSCFPVVPGVRDLRPGDLKTLRVVTYQGSPVPTVGGLVLFGTSRPEHFPDAWVRGRLALLLHRRDQWRGSARVKPVHDSPHGDRRPGRGCCRSVPGEHGFSQRSTCPSSRVGR